MDLDLILRQMDDVFPKKAADIPDRQGHDLWLVQALQKKDQTVTQLTLRLKQCRKQALQGKFSVSQSENV